MQTAIPSPRQLDYQDWEFGIFIHFGIRTFYEGHRDWDGKPMAPSAFRPTALDCGQWVRTAAEAGARYMVLTAKHHDGFANWPSAYTDFSVASSPWRDGHGDVVGEFVDACRAHGIKPGLYYSPAEWGEETVYEDETAYDDYFINQISEILQPYGPIDILWFDGCGSAGHEYDWPRICREIRRMQPEILLFNMGDPDFRWVGNELGLAPLPCWNTVDDVPVAVDTDSDASVGAQPRWLPAECDCRMRQQNWFYSDQDEHTVKSLDELMGLYYYSVGRGCNLLLNIGPDRRGLLPDRDTQRLLEFGREVRRRFDNPVATLERASPTDTGWEFTFAEPRLLDHVVLQEDLRRGEHVRTFSVRANPNHQQRWIDLWRGQNIGHKAICRFPAVAVRRLQIVLAGDDGPPPMRNIELLYTGNAS